MQEVFYVTRISVLDVIGFSSKMLSNLSSRAGELKAQGAVQAAQDPNSKITAHDAERVMADESKKAGIAAFQFDPDASPEDKAAQARSVC